MRYTFEEEFRLDHPETVGETDRHYDLDNYKDWLEAQLIEARKQLALYYVIGQSEQFYCNCSRAKELDHGEDDMPYCIECTDAILGEKSIISSNG